MTPQEEARVRLAIRIMGRVVTGMRLCWVCANRGHGHVFTGCREKRCPCGVRMLAPRAPAWHLGQVST